MERKERIRWIGNPSYSFPFRLINLFEQLISNHSSCPFFYFLLLNLNGLSRNSRECLSVQGGKVQWAEALKDELLLLSCALFVLT